MRAVAFRILDGLRSSYWFIPSVMALGAIALASLAVTADGWVVARDVQLFPDRLISFDVDGARAFLITVAGSMITVAGVAFSITMVAMSLASQQFGPRLLGNFMRDRGNQFVLGTFVATFLYCLMLLPSLRRFSEDEALPEVALSVAMLATLGSLGVFIYFIHHAATSIRVQTVIDEVGHDLATAIDGTWGAASEEGGSEDGCSGLRERCEGGYPFAAQRSGYLQSVDVDRIVALARDAGALVRRDLMLGRYVVAGGPLGRVLIGGEGLKEEERERLRARLADAFQLGPRRNLTQDVEAAAGQLVELAVRALSPGINDPLTAIHCVDVLASALARVLGLPPAPSCFRDEDGEPRLLAPAIGFERLLDASYHQIRQEARGNAAVTLRLLDRLADLADRCRDEVEREAVCRHAEMVRRSGVEALPEPLDRAEVESRYGRVIERLAGSSG